MGTAHRPQRAQGGPVAGQPRRLEDDLPVPGDAQPAHVLDDAVDMLRPAAGAVYVLDPQAEGTAPRMGQVHRQQRRPGVPHMQPTRGAWGEASHHMLRSEEHTSELQSLMRISYAVFCLKKKKYKDNK